jgi:urea transport system permease protein
MFGVVPSIEMVIWVAVGGRDALVGAIVGTLLVNFGKDWISSAFPDLWLYAVGALFVVVVTVMPQGIVGTLRDWRPRFARRAVAPAVVVEGQ